MKRALTEQRIDEMLEVVGLTDRKHDFVKKFSGGMKRRLEIARGLLHRPKVLFLDEPTLGLDPQTRSQVWGFLKDLKEREGNTVFMTTHYMDEAEACDRIVVIDKGRIIASDTPENLKSALSGDTIYLETVDDTAAMGELKALGLEPTRTSRGGLALIVDHGEKVIPKILDGLSVGVRTVNLKRPTLDDVFLHLTGREIREEEDARPAMGRSFRR
jgi:ABC-2 type transport system ATP-binding protein